MRDDGERGRDDRVVGKAVVVASLLVFLAGLGGVVWYLSPGGESAADVIERYRPRFAELRAKLRRIGDALPPPGSLTEDRLPAGLHPKPVYDVRNLGNNTGCLMAEQCSDPDRDPLPPREFNLRFEGNEFRTHLTWTGDRNPLAAGGRGTVANDLPARFERTLGFAYLVVARPVSYDPPRMVDEQTYAGGPLDLEVFLVDLPGEKVLGGFRRSFRPGPRVLDDLVTAQRDVPSIEGWVHRDVWLKARAEVADTLARGTGGTFVIEPARE